MHIEGLETKFNFIEVYLGNYAPVTLIEVDGIFVFEDEILYVEE